MQLKMISAVASLIGGLGGVGRSYIWPRRTGREKTSFRGSVMQDLLGLLVLIALGFAIAAANVWFAMLLRDFWVKEQAPTLGPIKLIGDEGKSATAANALPGLIVNHLNYERNQINSALGILTNLQDEEKRSPQPQGEYLPPSVFPFLSKNLDIELKIGAVDYGAILKALSTWLTPSRTLELTIVLDNDDAGKTRTLIYGNQSGGGGYAFAAEAPSSNFDAIAKSAATGIITQAIAQFEKGFAAISARDAEFLLDALKQYAELERRTPFNAAPAAEFKKLLDEKLAPLAERYSLWENLQRTALRLAYAAGDFQRVIVYAQNLQTIVNAELSANPAADKRQEYRLRLDRLQAQIEGAKGRIRLAAAGPPATSTPLSICGANRHKDLVKTYEPVLRLIGLPSPSSATGVRIGVVGPLPEKWLLDQIAYEVVGETQSNNELARYTATLIVAMCQIAADAKYVFAPIGRTSAISETDLLHNVKALAQADINILLLTFGKFEQSQQETALSRDVFSELAKRNIVAVTSAGNVVTTGSSAPKSGGLYPENENGLRVAASDLKGLPASFSPLGPDLIWAPGTNVLVTEDGHSFAMRSGTSYSASIAAAATAILLSARPEATPSEIRRAFSATARQVEPNGASIINVDAASQQLLKAPPPPK
jgi:subtilase family protein